MVKTPQSEVHMDTPKWVHLFQESALALDKTSTKDSRTKNHRISTAQRQTSDDCKKDSSFHRNHSGMSCPECGSVLTSQTLSRLPALQSLQDRDANGDFQEDSMPRGHWLSQRLQADTQSSRRGDRSARGLLLRNHWDSGRGSQWSVYAPGKRDRSSRLSRCRSCGYSSSSGDTAFLSQDLCQDLAEPQSAAYSPDAHSDCHSMQGTQDAFSIDRLSHHKGDHVDNVSSAQHDATTDGDGTPLCRSAETVKRPVPPQSSTVAHPGYLSLDHLRGECTLEGPFAVFPAEGANTMRELYSDGQSVLSCSHASYGKHGGFLARRTNRTLCEPWEADVHDGIDGTAQRSHAHLSASCRRARDKGNKRASARCLRCFSGVAMTLGTMVVIGTFLFLLIHPGANRTSGSAARHGKVRAVMAKVNLRILNMDFRQGMEHPASAEFRRVVGPFINQINSAFLGSSLNKIYYGAIVTSLGNGSIVTNYYQIFEDNGSIKHPDVISDVIQTSSKAVDWKGVRALQLGDFVICSDCINTTLQFQALETLPEPPVLPDAGAATTATTSSTSTTRPPASSVASSSAPATPSTTATSSTTSTIATSTSTISMAALTTPTRTSATPSFASRLLPTSRTTISVPESQPVVTMPNVVAYRDDVNTTLTCTVSQSRDWDILIIVQRSSPLPLLSLGPDGKTDILRDADNLLVSINMTSDSVHVTLTFRQLMCGSEGTYVCTIIRGGSSLQDTANVIIKDLPSQPVLTLPDTMIAGQELFQPISCAAELGHPEAFLSLTIQQPGEGRPQDLPSTTTFNRSSCHVTAVAYVTLRTPVASLNGSVVTCSLDHVHGREGNFSTSSVLEVLRGDVCQGVAENALVPHPSSCNLFLNCSLPRAQVLACPHQDCFQPNTGICGDASLAVETSVRPLHRGLTSVGCRLQNSSLWGTLKLRRILASGVSYDVIEADVTGNVTWLDFDLETRAVKQFSSSPGEHVLRVWIYVWKCFDEGTFECVADVTMTSRLSARGQLQIQAAPSPPKLHVPFGLVENTNDTVSVTCQSDVGYPPGVLSLSLTFPNGSVVNVTFDDVAHDNIANCLVRVRGRFDVKGRHVINGTLITCYVNSNVSDSPLASKKLLLLPADVCGGNSSWVAHPYRCGYYVDCGVPDAPRILACPPPGGVCPNASSTQCTLSASPQNPGAVEAACPSDGEAVMPHPSRCEAYLLCRGGAAQVRSCQRGQLFGQNATCTPDILLAHCFRPPNT